MKKYTSRKCTVVFPRWLDTYFIYVFVVFLSHPFSKEFRVVYFSPILSSHQPVRWIRLRASNPVNWLNWDFNSILPGPKPDTGTSMPHWLSVWILSLFSTFWTEGALGHAVSRAPHVHAKDSGALGKLLRQVPLCLVGIWEADITVFQKPGRELLLPWLSSPSPAPNCTGATTNITAFPPHCISLVQMLDYIARLSFISFSFPSTKWLQQHCAALQGWCNPHSSHSLEYWMNGLCALALTE